VVVADVSDAVVGISMLGRCYRRKRLKTISCNLWYTYPTRSFFVFVFFSLPFLRYFCPSRLGGGAYPKWEPRAITEGACRRRRSPEGRVAAGASPFPPGFKVLFYGNSYMRQVTV